MAIVRVPKDPILLRSALSKPDVFIRDIACFPRMGMSPFIRRHKKIIQAIKDYPNPFNPETMKFVEGFRCTDNYRRFMHIDLAQNRDHVGISMVHVPRFILIEYVDDYASKVTTIQAPLVKVDFWGRIGCGKGEEIILGDIREIIYDLSRRGFYFGLISFDKFQSLDSIQILRGHGYTVAHQSVDRSSSFIVVKSDAEFGFSRLSTEGNTNAAVTATKDLLYSDRLELPYSTHLYEKDWFVAEAMAAQEVKGKVDHPAGGSIDVFHSISGSAFHAVNNEKLAHMGQTESELLAVADSYYKDVSSLMGTIDNHLINPGEGLSITQDPREIHSASIRSRRR